VGSAAATVAASGSSAAASGGALLKSVLVWLSVGALGGAAVAVVATNAARPQAQLAAGSTSITAVAPRTHLPVEAAPASTVESPAKEQTDPTPAASDDAPTPVASARVSRPREVAAPDAPLAANANSGSRVANDDRANPNLYDQLRLIDEARSAAARRDTVAVLAILDSYDRSYPRGQFVPESLALRIETVARAGDGARARVLAVQFRRDYPQHPLLARVGAALGD